MEDNMGIKLIVDSTTNMKQSVQERISNIVPLTVNFGDEEYLDGIDISIDDFYTKLVKSDVMPTTSQGSPQAFEKAIQEHDLDKDSIIIITLASNLSGTYQSARIAAQNFKNVYVLDSGSVSIGAGILVEYALQLIDQDLDVESIIQMLEEKKKKLRVLASVDTLKYLHKGGRVSKTVAIAGGILKVKPLLAIQKGEISMVGKARGAKKVNKLLMDEAENSNGIDFDKPLLFGYTGTSDQTVQKFTVDCQNTWQGQLRETEYACIGSVVGTHAGPGAIALAYFEK